MYNLWKLWYWEKCKSKYCAIVSNGIKVKDGAIVSIGAVVVEDVEEKIQVSGNFAMPHNKFLKHFSKISKLWFWLKTSLKRKTNEWF